MIYCRKNSDQTQYLEMITCETVAKNKKTMIVIATIMDNLVSGVDNVSQLVGRSMFSLLSSVVYVLGSSSNL